MRVKKAATAANKNKQTNVRTVQTQPHKLALTLTVTRKILSCTNQCNGNNKIFRNYTLFSLPLSKMPEIFPFMRWNVSQSVNFFMLNFFFSYLFLAFETCWNICIVLLAKKRKMFANFHSWFTNDTNAFNAVILSAWRFNIKNWIAAKKKLTWQTKRIKKNNQMKQIQTEQIVQKQSTSWSDLTFLASTPINSKMLTNW